MDIEHIQPAAVHPDKECWGFVNTQWLNAGHPRPYASAYVVEAATLHLGPDSTSMYADGFYTEDELRAVTAADYATIFKPQQVQISTMKNDAFPSTTLARQDLARQVVAQLFELGDAEFLLGS